MNKILLVLLSIILFLLLGLAGTLLYAFSTSGNDTLKSYLQKDLENKLGLPVVVHAFTLKAAKSTLKFSINKQADVDVVTQYDLLKQSFSGIYRVQAENFHYKNHMLRQVDVKGHFKGSIEDIVVDGNGTALDAILSYRFHLIENNLKDVDVMIKGLELSEVLKLSGQAPLAKGKVDINIHMPDIGEEFANGHGNIVLHKALFDANVAKDMYGLVLPRKSYVMANMDMKLKGNTLTLNAHARGNLFTLKIEDANIEIQDKNVSASYLVDVQEMGILTQNKLSGAFKTEGKLGLENDIYRVDGKTHSLGGTLYYDISEQSKISFENLELERIFRLLKQPVFAKGLLSGAGDIERDFENGKYDIEIQKGQFSARQIEKIFGHQIPDVNKFSFASKGKIAQQVIHAEGALQSSLGDLKFKELLYGIESKNVSTKYDLFLPNIGLLMSDNKAIKRGYMSVKGELAFDKTLTIIGSAKGLGEKLDFDYDSGRLTLDADNLFIEKLLSLSSLPRYVKGQVSAQVKISDMGKQNGTFLFRGEHLETQAKVMERLIGKKLAMKLSFRSKGSVKDGIANLNTKLKTSMGDLILDNTVYDLKNTSVQSRYSLSIPKLEKTYALTGKKLYGAMKLVGTLTKDKILKIRGSTDSLGGEIHYDLTGDKLHSKMTRVALENILGLMGQDKLVQGDAYGTAKYDIKKKVGVVNIDIKSFQIKASSTTNMVKMFIGKDPTDIIYSSTRLDAKIDGDVTTYTLKAKGSRSSIAVTEGKLDKEKDTHSGKLKFVYEKYVVTGTIRGTIDSPSIIIDPSSIMQSKTGEKIQKKLDKALGGDMGKAVGGFLKDFKF